jgi:hypothetical protein
MIIGILMQDLSQAWDVSQPAKMNYLHARREDWLPIHKPRDHVAKRAATG